MDLQLPTVLGTGQPVMRINKVQNLDQMRRFLGVLLRRIPTYSNPENRRWALSQLEHEVPVLLLTALSELQQPLRVLPLHARQKGLRKAIEYINENAYDSPSIPDICAASCLSWRSLDRAFKECFGIGPKRYLIQFRLIRVHQMLKNAPASAQVNDIANAWGFWHMGDFAHKYRQFFGLYPAEQLMRSG